MIKTGNIVSARSRNDLIRVWLATEIQKNKGRGYCTDHDFEIIAQEAPIMYSSVEVLRERISTQGTVGRMFSGGVQIQEATLEWEGEEAQWCVSLLDKEYEASFVVECAQLFWNALCIEEGSFWTTSEATYKEIVPLRGIEDPTIDVRLQALADLPLHGMQIPEHLSLREWNIDASVVRIFLARPEYASIKTLDLAYAYTDGEELGAVFHTSWNSHAIQELHVDGISSVPASILTSCPNLKQLYARHVGWEHINIPKGMHSVDVRDNPIQSCTGVGLEELILLGIDDSFSQMASCNVLQSLHVHNLHVDHVPNSVQELSSVSVKGCLEERDFPHLRRLVVPHKAGLPNSPELMSLSIVGGEWTREAVISLCRRYPKLSSVCFSDAVVEEDAVLSMAWLESVSIRRCGLETLTIPKDAAWKYLDVSENTLLSHIDWSALNDLEALIVSHTSIPLASIAHSGALMGLQYLGADGARDVQCLCAANALVGVQQLSLRGVSLSVLDFLSNQALFSLEEVDLGANKLVGCEGREPTYLPRIRVDVDHPEEDDIRWLWRKRGHADIFHHNKLYSPQWWR